MPPRYPANPNRIVLDFDPITSDALTAAAKAQKTTRQRLAYELVQAGLGMRSAMTITAEQPPYEPDDAHRRVLRGIEDMKAFGRANRTSGDPDAK